MAVVLLIACQNKNSTTQEWIAVEKPFSGEAYLPAIARWAPEQHKIVVQSIPAALAKAHQLSDASRKAYAYWMIAVAQIQTGNAADARKTLNLATAAASQMQYDEKEGWGSEFYYDQMLAYRAIACAQVNAGDVAGARKTATLIGEPFRELGTYLAIAEVQAQLGKGRRGGRPRSARRWTWPKPPRGSTTPCRATSSWLILGWKWGKRATWPRLAHVCDWPGKGSRLS